MQLSTTHLTIMPLACLVAASSAPAQLFNQGVPLEESHALGVLEEQTVERDPRPLAPEPTPFTIEPGRLAIELDIINFAYDRHNPDRANERVRAWEWPLLFRYGVMDDLEIQFGMEVYVRESVRDRDAGTRETADGFGDVTLGLKYNLWGNDDWDRDIEGATALALIPYLRLPTNRHGLTSRAVEGGVFVPFAIEDVLGFEIEWTPGFHAIRNSSDDDYEFEWSSLLILNRAIVDGLDGFVEFESFVNSESGEPWVGQLASGLTWDITDNTVLEGGVGFGLTRSADDFSVFLTFVQRF